VQLARQGAIESEWSPISTKGWRPALVPAFAAGRIGYSP